MRTSIPRAPSRCPLLLLSSVLVLLLFGCATAPENGASSPTGETASPEAGTWRSQDAPTVFFAETELGCYNLADGFLYFAPAGSAEFQLLCSRPDCTHKGEDCNAYAGDAFTYYDGYLYGTYTCIDASQYRPVRKVVRISPDGARHEDVGCLTDVTYPNGITKNPRSMVFYNQYIYYEVTSDHPDEAGYESQIFRMNITTGENEVLPVSSESAVCTCMFYFQFDSGKWYALVGQVLPDGGETTYLACVDMDAGTFTLLSEGDHNRFSRFIVEDGIVLYFQPGRGFCQLDTETGEDQCVSSQASGEAGEIYRANYATDLIYCDGQSATGQNILQVYDRNYQLLAQTQLPSDVHFITATQDYILFGFYPTYGTGMVPTAYINKSDIGTGNLELISINQG